MVYINSHKVLLIFVASFFTYSVAAESIFVSLNAAGGNDGSSWEKALNASEFAKQFNTFASGTTFYLSEGTYTLSSTLTSSAKGFTLIGGYPTDAKGTNTELSSKHNQTVFKGDGNIAQLLSVSSTPSTIPVTIKNIDFTNAIFNTEGKEGTLGALYANQVNNLNVINCNFYNNTSKGYGGIAARLNSGTANLLNCTFHNNVSDTRGGAIRLSGAGSTTLQNCRMYDNSVRASSNSLGAAICVQHSKALNILNSAIYNNQTGGQGCAVYINGKNSNYENKLVVINSTISGNQGLQIQQADVINMYLANSIICCPIDNATSASAAILYVNSGTFVSGGHNIVGSVYNKSSKKLTFLATDSQSQDNTYANVFNSSDITEKNLQSPTIENGMNLADIKTLAEEWGITYETIYTDVNGVIRQGKFSGAFDPLTKVIKITDKGYATFYTDYSYVMPDNVKGAVVKEGSEDKISIDYIYSPNDTVIAKTGLLLKGTEGTYTVGILPAITGTKNTGNMLLGSEESETTTSNLENPLYYKLSDGSQGVGFYWGGENGAPFQNGANKAYLALNKNTSNARGFFIINDVINSISALTKALSDQSAWYTLQGVRIKEPIGKKGIFIHNNKKIIVR